MTNGQQAGYLGGFALMTELVRAGCSVNGLTQSDYGFDFHVQLPVDQPEPGQKKWVLSPNSVLIQLKSGKDVHEYVEITDAHWTTWTASPTPVYVAGVPTDPEQLWIEPVDSLEKGAELSAYGAGLVPVLYAPDTAWDVDWFLHDASVRSQIGSASLRQWWARELPTEPSNVFHWLGELACGFHYFDGSNLDQFGADVNATLNAWATSLDLPEDGTQDNLVVEVDGWTYQNGVNPAQHCVTFAQQFAALGAAFDDVLDAIAWGLRTAQRYWT